MPYRDVECAIHCPINWDRMWTCLVRRLHCVTGIIIPCVMGSWLFASESTPIGVPEPGQASTVEAAPVDVVTEPAPADQTPPVEQSAVDALIEVPPDSEALLEAALAAMDQAVHELNRDISTAAAVQHQQHAIDRLKELLAVASQSKSNSSSSSPKRSPQSSPDSAESSEKKSSRSSSSESSGSGRRRSDDANSAESTENVAGPAMSGSGVLAPGARSNNVWGHLPPREQEALFRSLSDSFLPEYESQIRRYYEALAEKK